MIIGMGPHKRSATIEIVDEKAVIVDEKAVILAAGRFGTDKAGCTQMLAAGRKLADRTWAVEGCNGIGQHIAHMRIRALARASFATLLRQRQPVSAGVASWPGSPTR